MKETIRPKAAAAGVRNIDMARDHWKPILEELRKVESTPALEMVLDALERFVDGQDAAHALCFNDADPQGTDEFRSFVATRVRQYMRWFGVKQTTAIDRFAADAGLKRSHIKQQIARDRRPKKK